MVCSISRAENFSDGTTWIFNVLDDTWSDNRSGNVVLGFSGYDSEGLSAQVYSGYYETFDAIPSNATEITSKIWRGTNNSVKLEGLKVNGSNKVPITVVLKRNGKVVDVLARYVGIQKAATALGDSYIYADGTNIYPSSSYKWDYKIGNDYLGLYTYTLDNDQIGYDKYCFQLGSRKGKIYYNDASQITKAVEGYYKSLNDASNAIDIKDQLFSNANNSDKGFVLELDKEYVFTIFFKDGGIGYKTIKLTASASSSASLKITAQPQSATVKSGEASYFSVRASGTGLKYLWQYKLAGASNWVNWTSKDTADISVAYLDSRNGMSVRCVVTDSSGHQETSDEAVLRYISSSINPVTINATNFPDSKFRDYISGTFDTDKDGILSETEITNITSIVCEEMNITSVKGIEFFPELEYLECYNNKIKSLDISKNPNLYYLEVDGNPIPTIDRQLSINL